MPKRLERAILLLLMVTFCVNVYIFWSARNLFFAGYPDFTSFYGAGKMVRQGQGSLLYDLPAQWNAQQQFAERVRIRKGPLPYLRLPFEALLFVPFSLLPYPAAFVLWDALNLCALIAIGLLLHRELEFLHKYPKWLPVCVALAFTPCALALLQGQDSILLLLAYTLAYVALKNGAEFRAGCFLALGLFKPHLVVPFVIIALLQRRARFVAGFASIGLGLLLVSVVVSGWPALLHYPSYIWWLENHTNRGLVLPRDTPNLRGLWEGYLSPALPASVITGLIAVSSLVVLYVAQRKAIVAPNRRMANVNFSLAVVATVLISYHAFTYDLSILLLPIFLVAGEMSRSVGQIGRLVQFSVWGPMLFLLFGPSYILLSQRFGVLNLVAVVLLLWMWGIGRLGQTVGG